MPQTQITDLQRERFDSQKVRCKNRECGKTVPAGEYFFVYRNPTTGKETKFCSEDCFTEWKTGDSSSGYKLKSGRGCDCIGCTTGNPMWIIYFHGDQ